MNKTVLALAIFAFCLFPNALSSNMRGTNDRELGSIGPINLGNIGNLLGGLVGSITKPTTSTPTNTTTTPTVPANNTSSANTTAPVANNSTSNQAASNSTSSTGGSSDPVSNNTASIIPVNNTSPSVPSTANNTSPVSSNTTSPVVPVTNTTQPSGNNSTTNSTTPVDSGNSTNPTNTTTPVTPVTPAPVTPAPTNWYARNDVDMSAFANKCLVIHNILRGAVGVAPLTWSDSLAASAQSWAENMAVNGFRHSGRTGENIASTTASTKVLLNLLDLWTREQDWFIKGCKYPSCSSTGAEVGHYTQMVWSTTTQVGCGYAPGVNKQWNYLCCQYYRAGNVIGQYVFPV